MNLSDVRTVFQSWGEILSSHGNPITVVHTRDGDTNEPHLQMILTSTMPHPQRRQPTRTRQKECSIPVAMFRYTATVVDPDSATSERHIIKLIRLIDSHPDMEIMDDLFLRGLELPAESTPRPSVSFDVSITEQSPVSLAPTVQEHDIITKKM